MRVVALTAHGRCALPEAEALVMDWFESEGLELVHGQEGLLIGWSEASQAAEGSVPGLAVEVRCYDLGGGWLQARWTLRLAPDDAVSRWGDQLLASLRQRLSREPLWQIDGP
jgi:hypothetical protein